MDRVTLIIGLSLMLCASSLALPVASFSSTTSTTTTPSPSKKTTTTTTTIQPAPSMPTTTTTFAQPHTVKSLKVKSTFASTVHNPYRFNLNQKLQSTMQGENKLNHHTSKLLNLKAMDAKIIQVLSKTNPPSPSSSSSSNNNNNNEKNWLLTKAWLIDNINRLKRELNELERDYSQHLDSVERINAQKEKQFLQDITKLRADHTVLSQQQKQIIYLIKKNQIYRSKVPSENDIQYKSLHDHQAMVVTTKIADAPTKRPIKRDLVPVRMPGENFESETRRNMKEMFTEISALHDLTLTLADDLRYLEGKVENKNSFPK